MKLQFGIFYVLILFLGTGQNGFSQKDIPKDDKTYTMEISSKDFSESITIARNNPEKKKINENLWYYWYLNNAVHFSEGGYSGKLLNGKYISYYKNMNLRSSGTFRYGLMHDEWTTWYENGSMKSAEQWKKGKKHGVCIYFSEDGMKMTVEKYRHGILNGKMKVFCSDSLVEVRRFKNGDEVLRKTKKQTVASEDSVIKTNKHKANRKAETVGKHNEKTIKSKEEKKKENDTKSSVDNADRKNRIKIWPFNSKKASE
ncbi:hypothetical protein SDC9_50348 [bioreactor metagenome]|uniref:MORN repeat variant n=1 Tax=bioreactor metagenome TaxID=1076179 RepID=A0A644WKR2_9ZZZZ